MNRPDNQIISDRVLAVQMFVRHPVILTLAYFASGWSMPSSSCMHTKLTRRQNLVLSGCTVDKCNPLRCEWSQVTLAVE
jgi:hypothetical protein